MSGLIGESEIDRDSTTTDADGRTSTTSASQYRSLAPSDALRRITPGQALLVYGYLPPVHLRLRPWYTNRELRRRAHGVSTPTAAPLA